MTNAYEQRLTELGIELPDAVAPQANYVPYVIAGDFIYISGQIPFVDGKPGPIGRLGENMTVEEGQAAARLCAINIVAQLKSALGGDLGQMSRCVKLGGFVSCTPDFGEQPFVINGASDLMVDVFGDAGRHARFAVGAAALPFGVAVEIDAIFTKR
jgi:enamine deaminase RidA (YjgF/YER057c/UK114 family)